GEGGGGGGGGVRPPGGLGVFSPALIRVAVFGPSHYRRFAMVRTSILAAIGALFVGLVAVPAAGAGDPPTRAELGKSVNNLKQIVLAFHNYESANAHLPNDVSSKHGKPLVSWRGLILPYLGEERV